MSGDVIPYTNRQSDGGIVVRASAVLTATYVPGTILSCDGYRKVRFWLSLDGQAASTGNEMTALVLLSPGAANSAAVPAAGDDVWYPPLEFDGVYTDETLTGTLAAGSDFTTTPSWRTAVGRPLRVKLAATTVNADKIRGTLLVGIEGARFVQAQFADVDSAGALGTLAVRATLIA